MRDRTAKTAARCRTGRARRGTTSGAGGAAWFGCESKVRFADENDAVRRAKEYGLRAYGCSNCRGWHLTADTLSTNTYVPERRSPRSPTHAASLRLHEAERILAKLLERQRAGVQLPAATIEQARARVDAARQELEDTKAQR